MTLFVSMMIFSVSLWGCGTAAGSGQTESDNQKADSGLNTEADQGTETGQDTRTKQDKPEKITIISTTDDVAYFEYVGKRFTELYDIDVEIINQSYDDTKTKITTSVTSGNMDIAYLDVVWPAEFAKNGMIISLDGYYTDEIKSNMLQGSLDQMSVNGSLYGLPFCNNGMFMFYNKTMLEQAGFDNPPETWDELMDMSRTMQEKGFCKYGIAWPGLQAEGSICNMTTMLYSFGGAWTDDSGNFTFNSDAGVAAAAFMRDSITDGWADPSSVSYSDRDILDAFLAGDTAFVTNWSYALGVANDPAQSKVAGQVDVCLVPGANGIRSAFVTGGGGLGILSTSKYPDYAWKYLELLAQHDVQAYACENYGIMPTLKSVFEDKDLQEQYEYLRLMYPQFAYPSSRPAVPNYSKWSNIVQVSLSSIIVGDADAKTGLDQAYEQVKDYLK